MDEVVPRPVMSSRMTSTQVYHFARSLRMVDDSFPTRRLFCRYVMRKLWCDELEVQAAKLNVSLTDVEERQQGRKRKKARTRGRPVKARTDRTEKPDTHVGAKNQKHENPSKESPVTYDPERKSSMQWTKKYAPQVGEDIIGNFGVVQRIQSWLEGWKKCKRTKPIKSEDVKRQRKRRRKNVSANVASSSEDDFVVEDSDSEDSGSQDSRDFGDVSNNTIILKGPSGCGKTSAIYALAHRLGFKVLEINASSARSGRQVMAHLHEATQSHHVHNKTEDNGPKKRLSFGPPSTSTCAAEMSTLSKTALILFKDVDVVFSEEDFGFYNAVNSLISTTKRPIVLTTSDPNFWLSEFIRCESIVCFEFRHVPPHITAKYLQLMCLCEGLPVHCETIQALIHINNGVISKSILDLQFWAQSGAAGPIEICCETHDSVEESEAEDGRPMQHHRGLDDSLPFSPGPPCDEKDSLKQRREIQGCDVDRIDPMAHLMFANGACNPEELSSPIAVRPQGGCCLSVLSFSDSKQGAARLTFPGSKAAEPRQLFNSFDDLSHLWPHGLGDFLEANKYLVWPLCINQMSVKPKVFMPDTKSCRYRKVRGYNRLLFSTKSDESDCNDDETPLNPRLEQSPERDAKNLSVAHLTRREATKKSTGLRRCMDAIACYCDVTSRTLPFTEDFDWWTIRNSVPADADFSTLLADDISACLQHQSMSLTCGALNSAPEEANEHLIIDVDDGYDRLVLGSRSTARFFSHFPEEQEVLNTVLPGLTCCPRMHVSDTLPVLRDIARSEATREAAERGQQSSRIRFRHYFQDQGIILCKETLTALCNAFI